MGPGQNLHNLWGGMQGKSKLAKMAWSGSLPPRSLAFFVNKRFVNNDDVTLEITYSIAHARQEGLA